MAFQQSHRIGQSEHEPGPSNLRPLSGTTFGTTLHVDTNNTARPIHFPHQHQGITLPCGHGHFYNVNESNLTLDQVKILGKSRLREISCRWKHPHHLGRCDAVLASCTLFRKHLQKHYDEADRAAQQRNEHSEIFLNLKCGWHDCSVEGFWTRKALEVHVQKVHIPGVRDSYCPFKTCDGPDITPQQYASFVHYATPTHSRPWTASTVLRPDPVRLPSNPSPPAPLPIDPALEWKVSQYLVHVTPYRPRLSGFTTPSISCSSSQDGGIVTRRSRPLRHAPPPPPSEEVRELIVPKRDDPDVYFWPMCGDAISGFHYGFALSSSIFPHPRFHSKGFDLDGDIVRMRKRKRLEVTALTNLSSGDGGGISEAAMETEMASTAFDVVYHLLPPGPATSSERPLTVQHRPRRPYLKEYGDAAIFHQRKLDRRRERIEEKARLGRQHKGKTKGIDRHPINVNVDDDGGEEDVEMKTQNDTKPTIEITPAPFTKPQILYASSRYSTKRAKMSYGAKYWEERMVFEQRGTVFGELGEFV